MVVGLRLRRLEIRLSFGDSPFRDNSPPITDGRVISGAVVLLLVRGPRYYRYNTLEAIVFVAEQRYYVDRISYPLTAPSSLSIRLLGTLTSRRDFRENASGAVGNYLNDVLATLAIAFSPISPMVFDVNRIE